MAYLVSVAYVLIVLGVCAILRKFMSDFTVRKIMHMLMASWWFIRLQFLDCEYLWIGPAVCAAIIFIIRKKVNVKRGMGLFCAALVFVTSITFLSRDSIPYASATVLTLGYADPLAALCGRVYQTKKGITGKRTFVGSLVFFIVCLIVCFCTLRQEFCLPVLIVLAVIGTLTEAFLFPEYDNIIVPLVMFDVCIVAKLICLQISC